jgi:hypothetical protein
MMQDPEAMPQDLEATPQELEAKQHKREAKKQETKQKWTARRQQEPIALQHPRMAKKRKWKKARALEQRNEQRTAKTQARERAKQEHLLGALGITPDPAFAVEAERAERLE